MSDWDNFNSAFFLSLATMTFAFLGITLKFCLKSKCDDVSLCFNLVHIHRRVELENQSEENTTDPKISSTMLPAQEERIKEAIL